MAHHEREWTVNEPDKPNVIAVYIIIVISLVGLAGTMFGLAEYKGHIDKKRANEISESIKFRGVEVQKKKNEPAMKVINQIVNEKAAPQK
jgi:hypothetical protein